MGPASTVWHISNRDADKPWFELVIQVSKLTFVCLYREHVVLLVPAVTEAVKEKVVPVADQVMEELQVSG